MNRRLTRLILAVVVAVFAALLAAAPAHAATNPPPPESPAAVGGAGAFTVTPDPLPAPGKTFDPNDLLTDYGTAGPTWHYYDLNPFEEVGASLWVELANNGLGNSKLVLSGTASFATWVFNPGSLLDQLSGPADASATSLNNGIVAWLLPLAILLVTALLTWAARKGKVGLSLTRVAYVIAGLALIGAGAANPSSYARQFSGLVSSTVGNVLMPGSVDENVKSDADAKAAAEAQKRAATEFGTRMIGPLYKAAVYDVWQYGMFGSATSKTAQSHAAPMFQDQALTWQEAADTANDPAKAKALTDAKKKDWAQHAAQINGGDPDAYPYVQGSRASLMPVVLSYAIIGACLPFLIAAMVLVLMCEVGLFLLAAVIGLIGLAVILYPQVLGKVGRFTLALVVNALVYAVAAGVVLKLSTGLLANSNVLLAIIVTAVLSYVAWKLLKPFRQFGEGSPAMRLNMDLERRYKQVEEAFRGGKYGAKKGAAESKGDGSSSAPAPDGAPAQVEALPAPDTAPAEAPAPVEYPKAPAAPTSHVALNTRPPDVEAPAPAASNGHTPASLNDHSVIVEGDMQTVEVDEPVRSHHQPYPGVTYMPTREETLDGDGDRFEPVPTRARPVAERVIFNPATGHNERVTVEEEPQPVEDGAPATEGVVA